MPGSPSEAGEAQQVSPSPDAAVVSPGAVSPVAVVVAPDDADDDVLGGVSDWVTSPEQAARMTAQASAAASLLTAG